jgi:hypothetical protein
MSSRVYYDQAQGQKLIQGIRQRMGVTRIYEKRFQLAGVYGRHGLMIVDYTWWSDNEREILNWMAENLPSGIEQQQGMTVMFDSERELINFLMRWGP